MVQLQGTERKYGETGLPDQEGTLAGAVHGAAVLDHAEPADGTLFLDAVVEQNHTVGDVFLDAVASQFSVARLGRDHRCDSFAL